MHKFKKITYMGDVTDKHDMFLRRGIIFVTVRFISLAFLFNV